MNLKQNFLSILLICLAGPSLFSQDILKPQWSLIESSKISNGNAEAWAIGTDKTGNILWGVNKDAPGIFEYMDAFVYKLDANKNLIWIDTSYIGKFAQQSYNLKVTDSLIYVGGRTCRTLGTDSCDALLFTTDLSTGKTGWNFVWDGSYGYEEIDGIALDSDGIYLTGWTTGKTSKVDVLVMKIDYSGNILWKKTWGSANARDDHQDGHIVVDDSMIYISGLYNGSPLLGWEGRALLAKFDKRNGDFVDSVKYGRQDIWTNAENALGMTSDGTYLYVTGYTTTSLNNWDIFVTKFDKDLNQIWNTTWGGASTESARAITLADDGSIYVSGSTKSYGKGKMDLALIKLNPSGEVEWYKTWGGTEDDQTLDIHLNGDNLYLTGKTQSFHPTKKWDALLLKVSLDSLVSIHESIEAGANVHFTPNPMTTKSSLKFNNQNNSKHTLLIYNTMGQLVHRINNIEEDEITLYKKDFVPGVFFYHLLGDKRKYKTGKLIID